MLTLTADVNGRVIARIFIHNADDAREPDACYYNAAVISYYESGTERDMTLGVERVWHKRGNGWARLARAILERVE
jgi:hypothetical protein